VAGYCQRHKDALLAAADKQPAEFVEAVKALVTGWRADGVKELSSL
jgi:hypothetical protein